MKRTIAGLVMTLASFQSASLAMADEGYWVFAGLAGPERAGIYWATGDEGQLVLSCPKDGNMKTIRAAEPIRFSDIKANNRSIPTVNISTGMPETGLNSTRSKPFSPVTVQDEVRGRFDAFAAAYVELFHACSRGVATGPNPSTRKCSTDQRHICMNADLSILDRQIADAYQHATRAMPMPAALDLWQEQRRYVEDRNACGKARNEDCLRSVMTGRLAALGGVSPAVLAPPTDPVSRLAADRAALSDMFTRHGLKDAIVAGLSGDTIYVSARVNDKDRYFAMRDVAADVPISAVRDQDLAAWAAFFMENAPTSAWLEHVNLHVALPADVNAVHYMPNGPPGISAARLSHFGPPRNRRPEGGYVFFDFAHPELSANQALDLLQEANDRAVASAEFIDNQNKAQTERRDVAKTQASDLAITYADALANARATASEDMLRAAAKDIRRPDRGAILPTISNWADERAAFETELAQRDRTAGRIYRGPWFWAHFEAAETMRYVFRGNRLTLSAARDTAALGETAALKPGTVQQNAIVRGWARAYEDRCGGFLPPNAPVFETTDTEIVTRSMMTRYGSVPMGETRTTTTTRIKMSEALYPGFIASRTAMQKADQTNRMAQALNVMRDFRAGNMDTAVNLVRPYIVAASDLALFLDLVGCDSPTARQMEFGVIAASRGRVATEELLSPEMATLVSDPVQAAGEVYTLYEVCAENSFLETSALCPCMMDKVLRNRKFSTAAQTHDVVALWSLLYDGSNRTLTDAIYKQCNSPLRFR